jgi:hypothetical protein
LGAFDYGSSSCAGSHAACAISICNSCGDPAEAICRGTTRSILITFPEHDGASGRKNGYDLER